MPVGMIEVWEGFWFLNRRRKFDNGVPQQISLGDINTYIEMFKDKFFYFDVADAEEKIEYVDLIADMDDEYLSYQYEQLKGG